MINTCGFCIHWVQAKPETGDHGAAERMAEYGYKTCALSQTKWKYVSQNAIACDKYLLRVTVPHG